MIEREVYTRVGILGDHLRILPIMCGCPHSPQPPLNLATPALLLLGLSLGVK